MKTNDFLFEIGTEELPATNLADFFEGSAAAGLPNPFAEKLKELLVENRLVFKDCRVWATPRRLAFFIEQLSPVQSARDTLSRVLTKDEAYDENGTPTQKFLTILKHRRATVKQTLLAEHGGKPYVFIKKTEPAKAAAVLLPEICRTLVKSLGFPKNMKWDESGIVFSRPIRHYLCLYGQKRLSFKIGNTPAAGHTVIFTRSRRKKIPVKSIGSYFQALKKNGVILDPAQRKEAIRKKLEALARPLRAKVYEDPFLLNEVTYLVEEPHAVSAPFANEFLKLPKEVLTVSMARKQRIFGVIDSQGKILARFLGVLDGTPAPADQKIILRNMENILHAKLKDSLFFYEEDSRTPLEKRREELKNLVFLRGAGSMLEKSERLARLADFVKKGDRTLARAAFLSKADLLTQMVGEFPELQGIMGKYYSIRNGEDAAVAEAISEQYLPRTATDPLPATPAGALLSILDKCDLIATSYGLGIEPSSSLDPYGLRRSAAAILKIIFERDIDLPLKALVEENKRLLSSFILKEKESSLLGRVEALFRDRFKALLLDRGHREDLVEAVAAGVFEKPRLAFVRILKLSSIAKEEAFLKAAKVVERTVNILKSNKDTLPSRIDPGLFSESLEHGVLKQYEAFKERILTAAREGDYRHATSLYAEAFFDILNEFFEKVFVNAEDEKIRLNRLKLLSSVKELCTAEIADLSKIRQP